MSIIDLISGNFDLTPPITMTVQSQIEYYVITGALIYILAYVSVFEAERLYHTFIR